MSIFVYLKRNYNYTYLPLYHYFLPSFDRPIATALSGNPPLEIAEELKDLSIQINLSQYLKRQGIHIDLDRLQGLVNQ